MAKAKRDKDEAETRFTLTIEVESRAIETVRIVGARLVPFSFKPEVRARLERPLSEWQACETFDVSGIVAAVGAGLWHDELCLRTEGLALLREWEDDAPYIAVYGTSGVGKSTLLQLAALRALVKGEPVVLRMCDVDKLIKMVDDERLSVERLALADLGGNGRPTKRDIVFCYDSPHGFHDSVGHAERFKRVFVVHSPLDDLYNTTKSDGIVTRFLPVPVESELLAVGAIMGVDADKVRERVARFGPTFPNLSNVAEVEKAIARGIEAMTNAGVEELVRTSRATCDVHRVAVMVPNPSCRFGVEMLVFASDFIRDEVVRRLAATHAADLLRLANMVDLRGSLRGQVFESRMLDTLSCAGAIVEMKTDGGTKLLQVSGAGVALNASGGTLLHGVLYRPPHSNDASWDALIVENAHTAYLLQTTVSNEHPVKRKGLVAGNSLLRASGFTGQVRLVYLMPPVVFDQFKLPQKVLDADGKESEAGEWPQDRWHVAAVDGVSYWPQ